MSNASWLSSIAPYAGQAARATGLDCRLFLVQWAYESTWGTSSVASHHNLAGIEHSQGKGCTCCTGDGVYTICPNLTDFAALEAAILLGGSYAGVLATRGQALAAQFAALGRSPWAAGHYQGGCGTPGCALAALYAANQAAIEAAARSCTSAPPPPAAASGAGLLVAVSAVLAGAWLWEHREVTAVRRDLRADGYAPGSPYAAPQRLSRRLLDPAGYR